MTKVMHRNTGPRLSKGMAVVMNDGWCGRVESNAGGIVACIAEGERPDDHWCGNYRLVGPRSITIKGGSAMVVWKSTAMASRPTVDREQRRAAVVANLIRSTLESEWESAPD
jgi:hypothetical protein